MTSENGVENIVKQQFSFHCSCGTAIQTSEKKEICPDCGETVEVVKCVLTPQGKKYILRISKHRNGRSTESLWPPSCVASPQWTRPILPIPSCNHLDRRPFRDTELGRQRESVDYNKRFTRLGLMILLAPIYIPLLIFLFSPPVDHSHPNAHVVVLPRPTDCDWFNGCHYEKRMIYDSRTGESTLTWERVSD